MRPAHDCLRRFQTALSSWTNFISTSEVERLPRRDLRHADPSQKLLSLLRTFPYTFERGGSEHLSWDFDGMKGTAEIGNAKLDGFARMCDPAKHLISFHIHSGNGMGPSGQNSST